MNETNRTYPILVAKIQVYICTYRIKPKAQIIFHDFKNRDRIKNMLNFLAIVYENVLFNSMQEKESIISVTMG